MGIFRLYSDVPYDPGEVEKKSLFCRIIGTPCYGKAKGLAHTSKDMDVCAS
jgi:hypothetical protein